MGMPPYFYCCSEVNGMECGQTRGTNSNRIALLSKPRWQPVGAKSDKLLATPDHDFW